MHPPSRRADSASAASSQAFAPLADPISEHGDASLTPPGGLTWGRVRFCMLVVVLGVGVAILVIVSIMSAGSAEAPAPLVAASVSDVNMDNVGHALAEGISMNCTSTSECATTDCEFCVCIRSSVSTCAFFDCACQFVVDEQGECLQGADITKCTLCQIDTTEVCAS